MNSYVNHIEESILLKLRNLVGQGLHYSYLGTGYVCYNLEKNEVECDSIAIRNRGKEDFLIISSDWLGDTEKHALDAREFIIEFKKQPSFLQTEEIKYKDQSINKIDSPTKFNFFMREEVITSIELFTYREECEDEYVDFDIGIVFHCGPKILIISSVLSIRGGLFITSSKEAYDNLKNECYLKEKWGK